MRLDLVVGPNGAGKSTFVRLVVAPAHRDAPFVNADVIAAQRWPDNPAGHAYEAARVAEATRAALINTQSPFIAETVFSHRSKLDLIGQAKTAGYYVALHVVMITVALAVQRVLERTAQGGHHVPDDKIRTRFERLWPLVADAVPLADTATFYDNTQLAGARQVAHFNLGIPVGPLQWPTWTPQALAARWPN